MAVQIIVKGPCQIRVCPLLLAPRFMWVSGSHVLRKSLDLFLVLGLYNNHDDPIFLGWFRNNRKNMMMMVMIKILANIWSVLIICLVPIQVLNRV